METLQEKSLSRAELSADVIKTERTTSFDAVDDRIRLALVAAAERKAVYMTVLDLREIAAFTDFFVILSGSNARQVQAISDAVEEILKKRENERALRIEGYRTAEWILMDYGDFVIHIFDEKARQFYDIERLWLDAVRVEIPKEIA